jgi:uncharacterized membrane protein SpoIIM required for sporulation
MIIFQKYYPDRVPSSGQLVVEGIIVAMIGSFFASWLFPSEAGLIAVFLAAVASTDSIERLLGWHRRMIFDKSVTAARANGRLTARLMSLLLGTLIGFCVVAMIVPAEDLQSLFAPQLRELSNTDFLNINFGHPGDIFFHNLYVMLFFFVIALPFRQGGVMLAVAWNASVWAATFVTLSRNWAENHNIDFVNAFARIVAATVPHMLIEAAAYMVAGIAGVFVSKAFLRYALESERFGSVLKGAGMLLLIGLSLITIGSLWEGLLAPQLATALSHTSGLQTQ